MFEGRRICLLACDFCGKEFKRHLSHAKRRSIHFCTVNCARKSTIVKENRTKTVRIRYGVDNVQQSERVQAKVRATNVERRGVEFPMQSPEVRERSRETCLVRYGVDHPIKCVEIKSKIDYQAAWRKQHETKKRNGTYKVSNVENRFFEVLQRKFGVVERQVLVEGRIIDFYVPSKDVFVQLDGVYWHGLDRPIEQITNSTSRRDVAIFKKWKNDRVQDEVFSKLGLRLIRLTDKDFQKCGEQCLCVI